MQQSESLVQTGHHMQTATASRACVEEAVGVPGLLGEGLPKMVPLKDGPTRYMQNSSRVISFQLSPMGLTVAPGRSDDTLV
jgi:hypothetical protein